MKNYKKRIETLEKMFDKEYLAKIFLHIKKSYESLHRLQGGQLDYFVDHMNEEMKRTDRFSERNSLAGDTLGYDAIRVLAVLIHHCQECAEDADEWHTRPGFCNHKD